MTLCKCGCGKPAIKTWNDKRCYKKWRNEHHPHHEPRRILFERDGGICSCCGVDTMALRSSHIQSLAAHFPGMIPALMDELHPELRPAGYPTLKYSWWQADHIEAASEGGSSGIENYRTLAWPCHKRETSRQAARMAENKRAGATLVMDFGNSEGG